MADLDKLKQAHKENGPYHSAREAVQSPTHKAMHKEIKDRKKEMAKKMPKSKCETCGGGHKNHASYTYKTGNV